MVAVIQAGIWKEVCMCVCGGGGVLGANQFFTNSLCVPKVHPTGGVLESVPASSPSLVSVSEAATVVQMLRYRLAAGIKKSTYDSLKKT